MGLLERIAVRLNNAFAIMLVFNLSALSVLPALAEVATAPSSLGDIKKPGCL